MCARTRVCVSMMPVDIRSQICPLAACERNLNSAPYSDILFSSSRL